MGKSVQKKRKERRNTKLYKRTTPVPNCISHRLYISYTHCTVLKPQHMETDVRAKITRVQSSLDSSTFQSAITTWETTPPLETCKLEAASTTNLTNTIIKTHVAHVETHKEKTDTRKKIWEEHGILKAIIASKCSSKKKKLNQSMQCGCAYSDPDRERKTDHKRKSKLGVNMSKAPHGHAELNFLLSDGPNGNSKCRPAHRRCNKTSLPHISPSCERRQKTFSCVLYMVIDWCARHLFLHCASGECRDQVCQAEAAPLFQELHVTEATSGSATTPILGQIQSTQKGLSPAPRPRPQDALLWVQEHAPVVADPLEWCTQNLELRDANESAPMVVNRLSG